MLDMNNPILLGFVFVFGLCVGSFLNVVALRFLSDEPITHPASHCTHCQTPLRPIDNIPVLSYLLLGGKCHTCKVHISVQYPLIELATAILFCLTAWMFGLGWQTIPLLFLIANLVVIFITDIREKLIFEYNSLSLIPVGLVFNLFCLGPIKTTFPFVLGSWTLMIPDALVSALIGIFIAFAFFEGMIVLSRLAFGTDGFGHGDTHLMMGVAAFLGWPFTVMALMLGFVAQTVPAIPMLVWSWIQNRQYVSLISGALSLFLGMTPLLIGNLAISPEMRMLLSLISLVGSLVALVVFFRQIRQTESYTYLPLGPALVIGALVALYYGQNLLTQYTHYLSTR